LSNNHFIKFKEFVSDLSLPEKFTFPFYYDPHPISLLASKELQKYLESQSELNHNFGLNKDIDTATGKMFGVLVVKNQKNELGYLSAFSGKLGNSNYHKLFVPPVYDVLKEDGLFKTAEREINKVNKEIIQLESNSDFTTLLNRLDNLKRLAKSDIDSEKLRLKTRRYKRREEFNKLKENLTPIEVNDYQQKSSQEGINSKFYLKELKLHWDAKIKLLENKSYSTESKLESLKKFRKNKSAETQHQLFQEYKFLNFKKETRSLLDIFTQYAPPSGAGECAAPKLLQYAFKNGFTPIAMAEFWWGISPKSEIKKHKQFYPSCIGKCKPILSHMLLGLEVDNNPLIINQASEKEIEYVYEDDDIIIINKPNELLSVPGKEIKDSVYTRVISRDKSLTGPVIVHRLDMSTSGIMILAKSKPAYKLLQQQFINRSIRKKYIAILDGVIPEKKWIYRTSFTP